MCIIQGELSRENSAFLSSLLSKIHQNYYRHSYPIFQMGEHRETHDGSLATDVFIFLSNKHWWSGLSTHLKGLGNAPKCPSSDVPKEGLLVIFTLASFSESRHTPCTNFKGKFYESILTLSTGTLSTLTLWTHWPCAFLSVVASLALPFLHIGWK